MGCRGVEWGVVSLLPPLSHLLAGAYNKTELVWIVEIWALIPGNNLHLLTQPGIFPCNHNNYQELDFPSEPTSCDLAASQKVFREIMRS